MRNACRLTHPYRKPGTTAPSKAAPKHVYEGAAEAILRPCKYARTSLCTAIRICDMYHARPVQPNPPVTHAHSHLHSHRQPTRLALSTSSPTSTISEKTQNPGRCLQRTSCAIPFAHIKQKRLAPTSGRPPRWTPAKTVMRTLPHYTHILSHADAACNAYL